MFAAPKMSVAMLSLFGAFMLPNVMAASYGGGGDGVTCGHLKNLYKDEACCGAPDMEVPHQIIPNPMERMTGTNPCQDKKDLTSPGLDNRACFENGVRVAAEQSGSDVTLGYVGDINSSIVPITDPYFKTALCPVNVHWHLGAEHRSEGEFDEDGFSPNRGGVPADYNPNDRRLAGNARYGYACRWYSETDPIFNTEYDWKYCVDMHVGETYEVHWPHSALGACGTPYQYQYPFYDGVFCGATAELLGTLTPQMIASSVGVQGQVFTIVNDEHYFYPDLARGMIVDAENGMGQEITVYSGSTTGTSRDNEICSAYAPITWQVDRKCHLISASSFDKMCADMKQMRDDMSDDLYPHGARELVFTNLTAMNHEHYTDGL